MQISIMTCPHQCQVKPVMAGQVPLIQETEGGEKVLERGEERGGGGGGGGEESAGPSGTRGRGSRGRATERRESAGPAYLSS